jgi:hypothetical protein
MCKLYSSDIPKIVFINFYPAAEGGVVERLVTQTSPQLDRSGPYLGTTLRTLTFT